MGKFIGKNMGSQMVWCTWLKTQSLRPLRNYFQSGELLHVSLYIVASGCWLCMELHNHSPRGYEITAGVQTIKDRLCFFCFLKITWTGFPVAQLLCSCTTWGQAELGLSSRNGTKACLTKLSTTCRKLNSPQCLFLPCLLFESLVSASGHFVFYSCIY